MRTVARGAEAALSCRRGVATVGAAAMDHVAAAGGHQFRRAGAAVALVGDGRPWRLPLAGGRPDRVAGVHRCPAAAYGELARVHAHPDWPRRAVGLDAGAGSHGTWRFGHLLSDVATRSSLATGIRARCGVATPAFAARAHAEHDAAVRWHRCDAAGGHK